MTLTVGSLFSGIGGLDLGLERAGMKVIWQSEIDDYASRVLKKHWPEVPNYGDIKDIKWGNIVRPNVLCGGYPCQPFSTAGKRNGTEDPRHLWPWVREAISKLRPDYAILENVRGHVSLGLDIVLREMASIGYDAEWQIVSAASVGAPHRRDRVFIVAYPNCGRQQTGQGDIGSQSERRLACQSSEQCSDAIGEFANSNNSRCVRRQSQIFTADRWLNALSLISSCSTDVAYTKINGLQNNSDMASIKDTQSRYGTTGDNSRTESRAHWWQVEPDVGRVAHGIPSRVDRLKGLGNAVVPQVAELIGRIVIDYEKFR